MGLLSLIGLRANRNKQWLHKWGRITAAVGKRHMHTADTASRRGEGRREENCEISEENYGRQSGIDKNGGGGGQRGGENDGKKWREKKN